MFGKFRLAHQVLILAIVALLAVATLTVLSFQHTAKLDALLVKQEQLLSVRNRLLRVERHLLNARLEQSQFVDSHQQAYFQAFEQRLHLAIDSIEQLLEHKHRQEISAPLQVLLKIIAKYKHSVVQILDVQELIGRYRLTGNIVQLQRLINEIQSQLLPLDNPRLLTAFTRLQLYEKDFAAKLDMRLASQLKEQSEAFQQALKNIDLPAATRQKLITLSQDYYANVSDLIENTLTLELVIAESGLQFKRLFPNLNESREGVQQQLMLISKSIRQQQQRALFETMLVFGLALVLLAIFAFLQVRNAQTMSTRLQQLAAGMRAIAQGDFETVKLPKGNDEIGVLAETFLTMSHQLQSQLETINENTQKLTRTNHELTQAKENAEQANLLKDKFVSLVVHDLRSPLSGMLAALDYMHTDTDSPLVEDHQRVVGRMLKIGYSLIQMTEGVLNISRIKTGKISPILAPTALYNVVDQVTAKCDYLASQKGIRLINNLPQDAILNIDPTLYGEVVQNLATNGIKFCDKNDIIRFSLAPNSRTNLVVTDTGRGIPEALQSRLFKIEEKTVRRGTAGEEGTGFGLPLSYDIVQAHGGTIEVESEEGQGASFTLVMPESSLITST